MSNILLTQEDGSKFLKMKPSAKTGSEKWKDIEDLINRWAKRNPQGAIDNERWVKESRADLRNKEFGKSGAEAMGRWGLSIHPELMQYIEAFYPKFLSTKDEMHEFMRRFPKFRVPEKT